MHYFIDGYNLLFRLMKSHGSLQDDRRAVIQLLNEKAGILGMNITLVFDAIYQEERANRTHFNHLEIFFTNSGESADDFIIEALKDIAKPYQETVVTSDRDLAFRAKQLQAKTVTIGIFWEQLDNAYRNKLKKLNSNKNVFQKKIKKPFFPSLEEDSFSEKIEGSFDYYLHLFEAEWKSKLEEERVLDCQKREEKLKNYRPRHPKKPRPCPFQSEH